MPVTTSLTSNYRNHQCLLYKSMTRGIEGSLIAQAGTYAYQFLVDGTWMTSPDAPVVPDDDGHLCNQVSFGLC